MSRIFLFGATGGVGQRLAPILRDHGHQVTGLVRAAAKAEAFNATGMTPVRGDLMDLTSDQMAEMLHGHQIAVFSAGAAGSGLERTTRIDGEGPTRLIAAAHQVGLRRVYLVSAFPEAGRGVEPKAGFEQYMQTKKHADAALAASALDWVILRPGTLRHEDGVGRVALGPALLYGSVARGDVARVLAQLIDTPQITRDILELTEGPLPVDEAVAQVVRR